MEATQYTALKVNYNRSTRTYELEMFRNAHLHMVHYGYFVYETATPKSALDMIISGRCIGSWKPDQRSEVIKFLSCE